MPRPMAWKDKYPDETRIAVGLRERGFSRKQVREWLLSEGHDVSERMLTSILAESKDVGRRARDAASAARRERRRYGDPFIRAARNRALRVKRAGRAKEVRDSAVEQWLKNPDFNPDTGGVG